MNPRLRKDGIYSIRFLYAYQTVLYFTGYIVDYTCDLMAFKRFGCFFESLNVFAGFHLSHFSLKITDIVNLPNVDPPRNLQDTTFEQTHK